MGRVDMARALCGVAPGCLRIASSASATVRRKRRSSATVRRKRFFIEAKATAADLDRTLGVSVRSDLASVAPERRLSAAVGLTIRELRVEQGMRQVDLAERANVHLNFIGFVERGQQSPSIDSVSRIARALGLPLSKLITRAERLLD
jgi:ribosome-binding protein aMBF1 (putative translation factor)